MFRVIFTICLFTATFMSQITSAQIPATASKVIAPTASLQMPGPTPSRGTVDGEFKIKPFKEWKNEMIDTAQSRLNTSKSQLDIYQASLPSRTTAQAKTEAGLDPQLERLQDQIQADESYLSFTKDLTVSDYFVGYLVKQKNPQAAFKEAALKLTPEEVAELLNAYATHISESNSVGKSSKQTPPKSKIPKSASDQLPL